MKIAVCAKVAPDTTTPRIQPAADGSGIDTSGIKFAVSPYDVFAATLGVELVEKKVAASVHLFTVGDEGDVATLRSGALALGCEDLTLIGDDAAKAADALGASKALAAAIGKDDGITLVLTGKQAIDGDSVQVPGMLAEFLGWPLVSMVSSFETDGTTFTAVRNVGGGVQETVQGNLPAVITCDKGLVQPRYAKLPQIMKAKKKAVHTPSLGDLGLSADDVAPKASHTAYGEPPPRPPGRVLDGGDLSSTLDQLVTALRDEAKVL